MKTDDLVALAVEQLAPEVRERVRQDVRASLENDLDCVVRELPDDGPHRAAHGSCDGISYMTDQAVILFRATPSRRENFTLAHELGHLLVRDCDEIQDWLADHEDPERAEEWLCDLIAQRLLLPPSFVDGIPRPLTAVGVVDLFDRSEASLAACAVAAAGLLNGPAGIILIEVPTGQIDLASIQPDSIQGFPANFPWRGQALPVGHPLQQLRRSAAGNRRGRMTWTTPWGARTDYYVDATRFRGQILAIFSDQDIWDSERLHLDPEREYLPERRGTVSCCGQIREVSTFPCPSCGEHYCPKCGHCRCDKRAATEVFCERCFLRKQAHLVVDGVCVDCS